MSSRGFIEPSYFLAPVLGVIALVLAAGTPVGQGIKDIFTVAPCRVPQTYRIGEVDERFRLDRNELRTELARAATVWNEAYGSPLFQYDPSGDITVNFIYDVRQELSSTIGSKEDELEERRRSLESEEAKFQSEVAAFEARLETFKEAIAYWNSQGGATQEVYESLIADQEALKAEADRLEAKARSLNLTASDFNSQVGGLNSDIRRFNAEIGARPEQGLYDGGRNTIDIYFYNSIPELEHTLIHEFGHAAGIDHIDDRDSVMYLYSSENTALSVYDKTALQEACREESVFTVFLDRVAYIIVMFAKQLGTVLPAASGE